MDLHWSEDEPGHLSLYAGLNGTELAWLERRKTYWRAVCFLAGIKPRKEYAPLDEHKADIEAKVQEWFGLANTQVPAIENWEAE